MVEAGFFNTHHVGDLADSLESLRIQHCSKLRRVVVHDREVGVIGQQTDPLYDLVFGVGHEVRRAYD